MSNNCKDLGLCNNCTHLPICSYRRSHSNPILFCEDFSYEQGTRKEAIHPVNDPEKDEEEERLPNGICRNCEERGHCLEAKKNHAIWECREYR